MTVILFWFSLDPFPRLRLYVQELLLYPISFYVDLITHRSAIYQTYELCTKSETAWRNTFSVMSSNRFDEWMYVNYFYRSRQGRYQLSHEAYLEADKLSKHPDPVIYSALGRCNYSVTSRFMGTTITVVQSFSALLVLVVEI